MNARRMLFRSLLMLGASGAMNRLSAQTDASDALPLRCGASIEVANIKRLPSVPAKDSVEACRALRLSIAAAIKKHPARVDSAVIWRHDFPELYTTKSYSLYQMGFYLSREPLYVEVVVDRKTWVVTVRLLEH